MLPAPCSPASFDEHLDTYEDPSVAEMVAAARTTWKPPEWQLVHISNGSQSFGDPKHSDLITTMPSAYERVPWIEIEAKQKENAIALLQQEWLTKFSFSTQSQQITLH